MLLILEGAGVVNRLFLEIRYRNIIFLYFFSGLNSRESINTVHIKRNMYETHPPSPTLRIGIMVICEVIYPKSFIIYVCSSRIVVGIPRPLSLSPHIKYDVCTSQLSGLLSKQHTFMKKYNQARIVNKSDSYTLTCQIFN